MKKICLVLILLTFSFGASAQNLRSFLSSCAWGVVGGATVGVVSLAFVDRPSESWNNVAKGASLGLYAGIGYGLYKINRPAESRTYVEPSFSLVPKFENGQIAGAEFQTVLYKF